jgi:hypothetical protein
MEKQRKESWFISSAYKTNSVAWVRERTVPTERQPLVDEVSANFCGKGCCVVSAAHPLWP